MKGAVHTIKIVSLTELAMVSTKVGKKIIINIAYCLLGHRKKDFIHKTARELGWVLMHGTMQTCEYSVKSMAK